LPGVSTSNPVEGHGGMCDITCISHPSTGAQSLNPGHRLYVGKIEFAWSTWRDAGLDFPAWWVLVSRGQRWRPSGYPWPWLVSRHRKCYASFVLFVYRLILTLQIPTNVPSSACRSVSSIMTGVEMLCGPGQPWPRLANI
jgi:hypothetical protein